MAGGQQTITFVSPGKQILGTPPAPLVATSISGLVVSFSSTTPAVCTTSGTALTLLSVGECKVNASQPGNANYFAAPVVTQAFQVEVQLLAQSIDYPQQGNQNLGTPAPALVATATSGLPVSFTSMTPAVCTVSGTALTLVSTGTCTTVASQAGNAVYAAARAVERSVTVSAAAQTINFAGPGNQTLGTPPVALSATATSGLPVSFASMSTTALSAASTTPVVCTVSGSTLTLVAVGTCTINANQAGNEKYAAAAPVTRNVTVSKATQTIDFAGPGNQTLGTAPPPLTATASSGLPVSFASTTPSTCTVSGNTLKLVAAGSCIIDASQAGNATYAAAPTLSRVFTVAAGALTAQTITFATPGNQTLGTLPPLLVASASSGLPVAVASSTPAVCTVSDRTLTLLAVGTCTLNASQAGNATYAPAAAVVHSITVGTAALLPQTITFVGPGPQTLLTAPPALSADATSGLLVSFASTTPLVCAVSDTTLTLVAEGTCTLVASQAGNATWAAATPVTINVTVSKATQSIDFNNPGPQTLGTGPLALSATATSGLTVTFDSTTTTICTVSGVSGATLTLVAAGACIIRADQAGNSTFAAATPVTVIITVNPDPNLFANAGFETAQSTILGNPVVVDPDATKAQGWIPAGVHGYTRSPDARTGSFSALVAQLTPDSNAVVFQNSKATAGMPNLVVGQSLTLTFWVKSQVSEELRFYNFSYALRFLNDNGNILAQSPVVNFATQTNNATWSLITSAPLVVPVGATSAFVEFSAAAGGRLAAFRVDDVFLKAQ